MNSSVHPHHRRHLRPAVRRMLTVTVVACIAVGGASFVFAQPFRCACRLGNFHVQRLGKDQRQKAVC